MSANDLQMYLQLITDICISYIDGLLRLKLPTLKYRRVDYRSFLGDRL